MVLISQDNSELCAPTKPKSNNTNNRKKQRSKNRAPKNRGCARKSSDLSVDTVSTASSTLSSDSGHSQQQPASPQHRRRNRGRKQTKRGRKQEQQQQSVEELFTDAEKQRYVALDCEMVGVGAYGQQSALARVTLVDWHGAVVLDEHIRPDRPVTDYRTFVSGIYPHHLESSTALTLEQARARVSAALTDRVLVGHGLKNDLAALGIRHPWQLTRDTAKYEPFQKVRFDDGVLWPRKLRDLVREKLGDFAADFQAPGVPHCPVQDAVAALELYKKVARKWEKIMAYKVHKTAEIEQQQQAALALQQQQQPGGC